jgi:ATP-dependent DNA helicase RecG
MVQSAKNLATSTRVNSAVITSPVSILKGVGPKIQASLNNMGIYTIGDLLFHFPIDVLDWKSYHKVVTPDIIDTKVILLVTPKKITTSVGNLPNIVHCIDEAGQEVKLPYFSYGAFVGNLLRRDVPINEKILVRGKLKYGYQGYYEIANAERHPFTNKNALKAEAIYRLSEGITLTNIRKMVAEALDYLESNVGSASKDWLSDAYLKQYEWRSSISSLRSIHYPSSTKDLHIASKTFERLAFDELVMKNIEDIVKASNSAKPAEIEASYTVDGAFTLTKLFERSLPFQLTDCQKNATQAIYADMKQPYRMKHLLQGDVGSGKSVVSFLAMLRAVECGKQALLLAPTDILARQHLSTFRSFIEEMMEKNKTNPVFASSSSTRAVSLPKLGFLSSDIKGKVRERLVEDAQRGEINLVIGTHALLSDGIFDAFSDVGLVVIDEEQRFGVEQRNILAEKANTLLLSATPIPRTHLLFMQRGHQVSILLNQPKRKRPISTLIVDGKDHEKLLERIKIHLPNGTKVFWVCASLNPVSSYPGTSAMERYEELSSLFPEKVGLIHGQMAAEEKEAVMREFSQPEAKIQILVSTTVIEVGIDVADVSLCVIDRADRYGLTQLHQIRGRIGRGPKPPREQLPQCYCMLVSYQPTSSQIENDDGYQKKDYSIAMERLSVLKNTTDGFKIAEADLTIRGPGDVFGSKQSGKIKYRVASLPFHHYLLSEARSIALKILDNRIDRSIINYDTRACATNAIHISSSSTELLISAPAASISKPVTKRSIATAKTEKVEVKGSRLIDAIDDSSLLIAIDFEATGFSTSNDRIIELGACVVGSKHLSFNSYINPGEHVVISEVITSITTITRELINREGKPFASVFLQFLDWIEEHRKAHSNVILIAHNGKTYDFPLLRAEIERSMRSSHRDPRLQSFLDNHDGYLLLDSLTVLRKQEVSGAYKLPSKGLSNLYEFVSGQGHLNAHTALADVHALDRVIESEQFRESFRKVAPSFLFRMKDI